MSTTLPLVAGTGADTIGRDAPSMDEETFRSLYARIASPLRAYLLRLSGDPALSDDLLQDTFVRLLQGVCRRWIRSGKSGISFGSRPICCTTITGGGGGGAASCRSCR